MSEAQSAMAAGRYRAAAGVVLGAVTLLVLVTYRDYGITWDEEWQNVYGEKLLAYYLSGFQDRSAFDYRDLYLYGGAFDLVAAAVTAASRLGEYETRHLFGGLVGIAGMVGAWRLARLLAGERAAFLAVVLIALTPSLYGHMFNNPKDAPFAWAMIWAIYFACRIVMEMPRPSPRVVLGFGVTLGLAVATRVAGVLALVYLGAAVAVHGWLRRRGGAPGRAIAGECAMLALRLLPAIVLAYALMAVFWPWSVHSPLNPIRALIHFADVPWKGVVLVDGERYHGTDLPAYYLPRYLAIQLPEIVIAGLVGASCVLVARLRRGGIARREPRLFPYLIVLLAALFPIAYAVIARPLDFNGIRHFLFTVPPLVVLAAVGLDAAWTRLARIVPAAGRAFAGGLALAAGVQAWTMTELHPNEYVYYNEFVGGTRGAAGRYELDYWGNSLAEASRGLARYLERERHGRPAARVHWALICGYPLSALYFLPPNFRFTTTAAQAEFYIGLTEPGCDSNIGGRPIVAVERDGAVLSVVTDRRHLLATSTVRTGATK